MGCRKLFWLRRRLFAMGNVSYLLWETYVEIYPQIPVRNARKRWETPQIRWLDQISLNCTWLNRTYKSYLYQHPCSIANSSTRARPNTTDVNGSIERTNRTYGGPHAQLANSSTPARPNTAKFTLFSGTYKSYL